MTGHQEYREAFNSSWGLPRQKQKKEMAPVVFSNVAPWVRHSLGVYFRILKHMQKHGSKNSKKYKNQVQKTQTNTKTGSKQRKQIQKTGSANANKYTEKCKKIQQTGPKKRNKYKHRVQQTQTNTKAGFKERIFHVFSFVCLTVYFQLCPTLPTHVFSAFARADGGFR